MGSNRASIVVAELAIDADRLALRGRGVPEGTSVGDRHAIVAVVGIGSRVAHVEVLEIIVGQALGGPVVSIGAVGAADIAVIVKSELADDLAMIGHDLFSQAAQLGIAVADGQVTEDLIVSAVFLDDVKHVLDAAVVDLQVGTPGAGVPAIVASDQGGLALEVAVS